MFTGIVAAVGRIATITSLVEPSVAAVGSGSESAAVTGVRLHVQAGGLDLADVAIGDSIALQGACMTVIELHDDGFDVEVSHESLRRTVGLDRLGPVNLEKALRLGDRLGGHMVSGHVDGVAELVAITPQGESRRYEIRVPTELGRFLAPKGSVTIDGVSLTVNTVDDSAAGTQVAINLIPHTLAVTTLGERRAGDRVNIEVDLIARHVERLLGDRAVAATASAVGTAAAAAADVTPAGAPMSEGGQS